MLGDNFINTIIGEHSENYDNRKNDAGYLKEKTNDFSQYFYVCCPDAMIENMKEMLQKLGVNKEKIVIEEF